MVLAALAFFALRPRKGWLRRKGATAKAADAAAMPEDGGSDKSGGLEDGTSAAGLACKAEVLDTFLPRSGSVGGSSDSMPAALPYAQLATQPPSIAVVGGALPAAAPELDSLLPLSRATASQMQAPRAPEPLPAASGPLAAPAGLLSSHALPPSYITSAGLGSHLADPLALPGAAGSAPSGALTGPQTASRSAR